ncbi:16S rRNA (uracil(1498)-N(3))-methyltransferase [Weissella viridescens]|uniref:Ribosomal RNA small subunit methyltransferase E n=1 Tax=Weissella viridescens TaxID=1629 RepID=A0A3P2RGZ3_WEIVI|nr:RsmE family RNA methyltransferase [Weissella viridescens]RRG18030.1 16S rRNA (uracil(1498)-N(3))-methyltransferase [Weissella viridescens]
MQRYFLDEMPRTETFILPEDIAHHFVTVLRARIDDEAEFVLPDRQTIWIAKVAELTNQNAVMQVVATMTPQVELPVKATIILGLSKGDKPDYVVQKATELGVHEIIFVETEWSVVHWGMKSDKKLARLEKIAKGASEQSHRLEIPTLRYIPNLQALDLPTDAHKVVAWEESAKQGERSALATVFHQLKPQSHLVGLVGPEGGLSEAEMGTLSQQGFIPVGLGPRILRAETAPLYLLSALSYALELN